MRQLARLLALFVVFAMFAAACGSDDSSSDTEAGGEEAGVDQVFFILDWIPKGQTSPFYLALDKGCWADRNIAVQITRGFGSGDTSTRIGLGEGDFGFAGVGAVMRTISRARTREPSKVVSIIRLMTNCHCWVPACKLAQACNTWRVTAS